MTPSSPFSDPNAPHNVPPPASPSLLHTPPAGFVSGPPSPHGAPIPDPAGATAAISPDHRAGEIAAGVIAAENAGQTPDLLRAARGGADWFFWIAGLTILNSLLFSFNTSIMFPLGLAASFFPTAGIVLAFVLAAAFLGFGVTARQGALWAFWVGGALYLLDALIYAVARDVIGVLLHGWALFSLFNGYRAFQQIKAMQQPSATMPNAFQ